MSRERPKRKPDARGIRVRIKPEPGVTPRKRLRKPLYLPCVVGEDFAVPEEFPWEDFQTVGAGEFSQASGGRHARLLRSLDLEALAMYWDPQWMTFRNQDPQELYRMLQRLGRRRVPFKLAVDLSPRDYGYPHPPLRCLATLRSMEMRLRRGETDSRYFALTFREYREFGLKRRRHGQKEDLPTKHELTAETTFRAIARRYYGREELWRFLARRNGLENWGGSDPVVGSKRFKVGDKVRIPEEPKGHGGGDGKKPEDEDLLEDGMGIGEQG